VHPAHRENVSLLAGVFDAVSYLFVEAPLPFGNKWRSEILNRSPSMIFQWNLNERYR
jgi:hypothetical protein